MYLSSEDTTKKWRMTRRGLPLHSDDSTTRWSVTRKYFYLHSEDITKKGGWHDKERYSCVVRTREERKGDRGRFTFVVPTRRDKERRVTRRVTIRVTRRVTSSVQFKMIFMRSGRPICAPPRLS